MFAEVSSALGAPAGMKLAVSADATDLSVEGDTLVLPLEAVRLARSPAEARGLFVLVLAFRHSERQENAKRGRSGIEEWILGGAILALGEALDPIPNPADRNNLRAYGDKAPAVPDMRGSSPPSRKGYGVLVAMSRAGTCSAPALAYLDRLAHALPSAAAAALARKFRAELGPLAYPPQESAPPAECGRSPTAPKASHGREAVNWVASITRIRVSRGRCAGYQPTERAMPYGNVTQAYAE